MSESARPCGCDYGSGRYCERHGVIQEVVDVLKRIQAEDKEFFEKNLFTEWDHETMWDCVISRIREELN